MSWWIELVLSAALLAALIALVASLDPDPLRALHRDPDPEPRDEDGRRFRRSRRRGRSRD